MKALILAAGLGTRLGALTLDRPKPMLPVGGRPLLEHTVGLLRAHGVRDIAMNVHYFPEAITSHFGDGAADDARIVYSREPELLGTAGAARHLIDFLDEPFFVIYGDVLTDEDLSSLAAWHRSTGAALTMTLYRVEDPTRVGIVGVDESGRVVRFVEKPPREEVFSDLANTGILIVEPSVLRDLPADTYLDFGQHILPQLLSAGAPVYARPTDAYVVDIGGPERYAQAQDDASAGRVRLFHREDHHREGTPVAASAGRGGGAQPARLGVI
jgi:mannose-1-phosphate guanylyltransferase/phosphomannomutase